MQPIVILMVEDEADQRELYTHFINHAEKITPCEIEIVTCDTLEDAGSLIQSRRGKDNSFDVVLLDPGLPDSGRHDTINSIPRLKDEWRTMIFVITVSEDIQDRERCLAMGADEFTIKRKLQTACGCVLERIFNLVMKERLLRHDYKK